VSSKKAPLRRQRRGGGEKFTLQSRTLRARNLLRTLKKLFPKAGMMLQYKNPWELLVAVVLSAQCTDKKVNEVTEKLFKKYRVLDDYVCALPRVFEKDIHATGFYRAKTRHILLAAKMVKDHFGGHVPRTMEELLTLPGVGRKTANIILGNAFGHVEGIAVDTHVHRFAVRFDLTDHPHDTDKIEKDLMQLLPKKDWFSFTYYVIEYGRHIAPARRYDTSKDPLVAMYPPAGKVFSKH